MYRFRGFDILVTIGRRSDACDGVSEFTGLAVRTVGGELCLGSPEVVEDVTLDKLADGNPAMDTGRLRVSVSEGGGEFVGDMISCFVGITPGGEV